MTTPRTDPPTHGAEYPQLRAWLDYQRATLRMKCEGLDAAQLAARLEPSTLTLGGLLKHMALVEDHWFSVILRGHEPAAPWQGVAWDSDPDFEFRTAVDDSPEQLVTLFDEACVASDHCLDEAGQDPAARAVRPSPRVGTPFDQRWILVHMIGEYARHNGHADLIRESIDGTTGD